MVSNKTAFELFKDIREMPVSHKTHQTSRACQMRAYEIANILKKNGVPDVQKAWIYSPSEDGSTINNVMPPVHVALPIGDDDYDANGELSFDPNKRLPYNFHVAPVVTTDEGLNLAFDTYYYETPPTLWQWSKDFKPLNETLGLLFKSTQPEYLSLDDTKQDIPNRGSFSYEWYNLKNVANVKYNLALLYERPAPEPLSGHWDINHVFNDNKNDFDDFIIRL